MVTNVIDCLLKDKYVIDLENKVRLLDELDRNVDALILDVSMLKLERGAFKGENTGI